MPDSDGMSYPNASKSDALRVTAVTDRNAQPSNAPVTFADVVQMALKEVNATQIELRGRNGDRKTPRFVLNQAEFEAFIGEYQKCQCSQCQAIREGVLG